MGSQPFFSQPVSTGQFYVSYSKNILDLPSACHPPMPKPLLAVSEDTFLPGLCILHSICSLQSPASVVFLSLCLVQDPCFDCSTLSLASLVKHRFLQRAVWFSSLVFEILPQLSLVPPSSVGFRSAASSGEPPLILESGPDQQLGVAFIPPVFMVSSVQVW